MKALMDYFTRNGTESKSTDKLLVLVAALDILKDSDILKRVTKFSLIWKEVDGCVVPMIEAELS